jgi:hypothetical protein
VNVKFNTNFGLVWFGLVWFGLLLLLLLICVFAQVAVDAPVCKFFLSAEGCPNGDRCKHKHVLESVGKSVSVKHSKMIKKESEPSSVTIPSASAEQPSNGNPEASAIIPSALKPVQLPSAMIRPSFCLNK